MRKHNAAISIAALSLAAVAATSCGGNASSQSSYDPNDTGDLTFDSNGQIVYEGVNLTMWSVTTGDDATTQDQIVGAFNELYDGMIHVEVTHTSRYDLE